MPRVVLAICLAVIAQTAWSAPVIYYTDVISGPNSGGENDDGAYLCAFGTGFGTPSGGLPPATTTMSVNGQEVATYKFLGPSNANPDLNLQQLCAQVGNVSTGAVVVTENGTASNSDHIFTVEAADLFYVALTGEDDAACGAYADPCRTVRYVRTLAAYGDDDWVVIRGGTWDVSDDANGYEPGNTGVWTYVGVDGSNTPHSGLKYLGYPGETVSLTWVTAASTRQAFRISENSVKSEITIANISMDLMDTGAIPIQSGFYSDATSGCDDCRIINLHVHGGMKGASAVDAPGEYGGVNAISLQRVTRLKFLGNDVGDNNALTGCGSHELYVSHFYDNAEFAYNYLHDNSGGRAFMQFAGDGWGATPYGIDNGTWGENSNVLVHHNLFKNLPDTAILMNLGSFGPFYIYDNIIENISTLDKAGFSTIALRGAYSGGQGDYRFYNNTIYTAGYSGTSIFQFGYNAEYPGFIVLTNNIVYASEVTTTYYSFYNEDFTTDDLNSTNNCWYGSTGQSYPAFEVDGINGDPGLSDPENGDFTIASALSSVVNAGVNSNTIFTTDYVFKIRGIIWDVGAHEDAAAASVGGTICGGGTGSTAAGGGTGSTTAGPLP